MVAGATLALAGCLGWQTPDLNAPADHVLALPQGQAHFRDIGQGPPVVLLHGYGASLATWREVIEPLAQDHRVLALDARGFGLSSRTEGDYSVAAMADDVVAAMDARGVQRASIVAHSWGVSTALALALRHPERVDKLVLVDGVAWQDQLAWGFQTAKVPLVGELVFGAFYTAQEDQRLEASFYDASTVGWEDVDRLRRANRLPGSRAAALAIARGLDLEPWSERYALIPHPSLVIWGRQDGLIGADQAERLGSTLVRADVEFIDRCGHFPMLEAPERFVALVQDFLR
jgi:2-hydroxymuconate-semialdehyde hydrolase